MTVIIHNNDNNNNNIDAMFWLIFCKVIKLNFLAALHIAVGGGGGGGEKGEGALTYLLLKD